MRSAITSLLGWVILGAAALLAVGCGQNHLATSAADFAAIRLLDVDGLPRGLWPNDQSSVTVAVFTRSDCPISNRYAPDIRQLYERFHPRGVEFYLVYVDPRETPAAIRDHLKEYEYPCPALRDPEHRLVATTGATVTPEAVVFDAGRQLSYRGRIDDVNIALGSSRATATKHDLADAIEATLAGKPVAEPVTEAVGCIIADLK
jgi:AhpC/TSA family